MNQLTSLPSFTVISQPNDTSDVLNITDIPDVILELILNNLSNISRQQTILVSKKFTQITIDGLKKKETALMQEFVDFVCRNLDTLAQKQKLNNIAPKKTSNKENQQLIIDSANLIEIKERLDDIKHKLAIFLFSLDKTKVDQLERTSEQLEDLAVRNDVFNTAKKMFAIKDGYLSISQNHLLGQFERELWSFFHQNNADIKNTITLIDIADNSTNTDERKELTLELLYDFLFGRYSTCKDPIAFLNEMVKILNHPSMESFTKRNNLAFPSTVDQQTPALPLVAFLYRLNNPLRRLETLTELCRVKFTRTREDVVSIIKAIPNIDDQKNVSTFFQTIHLYKSEDFSRYGALLISLETEGLITKPIQENFIRENIPFYETDKIKLLQYVSTHNFSDAFKSEMKNRLMLK